MNQENAYSKGCEVKYLLKSKTSFDLVEFNSQILWQQNHENSFIRQGMSFAAL